MRESEAENSARSAMDRYCFSRNFFSSAINCCVVKGVRGLRLGLCLRNWQRSWPGPSFGRPSRPPLCRLGGSFRSASSVHQHTHTHTVNDSIRNEVISVDGLLAESSVSS